jgi:protein arginine kinase activator
MQKCTYCGKTQCKSGVPSVHALDVRNGKVENVHFVCEAVAEQLGLLPPKAPALQLSAEILENLLGGLKSDPAPALPQGPRPPVQRPVETACPACSLTLGAFKMRGRLGCPRCYEVFRPHVVALLERVHDASAHRGRFPGRTVRKAPDPVDLADLRKRLENAIHGERYEEAARLRDQLRRITGGDEREEP